jgi:cysteine sulfinate desulfinase/cysteine desulfurase-like protein
MGVPAGLAVGSLRISLGRDTTDEDAEAVATAVPEVVERLRMMAVAGNG